MKEEEDRISQLPEHILNHHILPLLFQDDAVRTCILSKSWRHLGPTRPKIEFHETSYVFPGSKKEKKFMSVVDNTLQRYDDKKLPVQELVLSSSLYSSNKYSCSILLNKWIVKLHMLKRLSLKDVYIEDETFDKIMSSCPLIQHLFLDSCQGLSTIKLNNKAPNLKRFDCVLKRVNANSSIEIDGAPSLETICINGDSQICWYNQNYFFAPRLKSLCLVSVHLPNNELLNNITSSYNCPCLEELEIRCCKGLSEFKLSNRSIKRLIFKMYYRTIKALDIDVPNILYFELESRYLPMSFSFETPTSRDWKSRLVLWSSCTDVPSTWSLKLYEILKALRKSQISLHVSCDKKTDQDTCDIGEPIVVQHLYLREHFLTSDLFRICRPRYIRLSFVRLLYIRLYLSEERNEKEERNERQLAVSVWNTLENKGRQSHFWEQDLEESSIQDFDEKTNEWRDVQGPCNKNSRFRLKWRTDFS